MSKLKPKIYNEDTGGDYILAGDYYVPSIELAEDNDRPIGKWGRYTGRIWKKQIHFCSTT